MRAPPLVLLVFALAPTLAACGGTTQPTPDQPDNPGNPGEPAQTNEAPTYLSAASGSSLYVVAARASAGTVVPFGPALPADASLYDVSQLTVSADNSHVALVLRPKVGTPNWTDESDTLVVGDGGGWTSLFQGPSYSVTYEASMQLGLFSVQTACPGSSTEATRPLILAADGTHVFEGACGGENFVGVFAPNDAYFVVEDAIYAPRPGATGAPLPASATVGYAFETSLIVFPPGEPNGQWIDTSGAQLSVAGFAPYTPTPAGLLDIQSELYALGDRTVTALQPVPPGTQPDEIAAVVGDRLTMLRANQATSASLVDAAGDTVGSYTPGAPVTSPVPQGLQIVPAGGGARWLTPSTSWVVFENTYETVPASGSGFTSYELSEDLWIVTDAAGNAAAQTIPIRHVTTSQAAVDARTYVPSGDGSSVLYVDGTTVHAIDVASGTDHALASSFQATGLARRCDASCVVF